MRLGLISTLSLILVLCNLNFYTKEHSTVQRFSLSNGFKNFCYAVLGLTISSGMAQEEKNALIDNSIQEQSSDLPTENKPVPQSLPTVPNSEDLTSIKQDFTKAVAVIQGTKEGLKIKGEVKFIESPAALIVIAKLENVPNPGDHGFHIHENGSCENEGADAGGHYNPTNSPHGNLLMDGMEKAHAGDMGNIVIDENGTGTLTIFLPGVTIKGSQHNVEGKAVILHEKKDDFDQPTGNAGRRIGCGIIQVFDEFEEQK